MPATADPKELGPQDYVIIALKAHQAWEVAEQMAPLLGKSTAVMTAQNGLPWWYFHGFEGQYADRRIESVNPDDRQWNAIGPERVIGCTVYPAAEVIAPGVIKHIAGDKFGLGEPTRQKTERIEKLSANIRQGGAEGANPSGDPQRHLAEAVGQPVLQSDLRANAGDPRRGRDRSGTRNLSRAMMLEAERIGRRIGAHFRVDVDRRIDGAAKVGAHRTSMLQDLEKGRPLEIDAMLTAVQELGRLTEVDTPFIDAVLGLVQQMARVAGLYPTFPDAFSSDVKAID